MLVEYVGIKYEIKELFIFMLFAFSIFSHAEPLASSEQLNELARVTGAYQITDNMQKETALNNRANLAVDMLVNLKKNHPKLSTVYQERALKAYQKYMDAISYSYSVDEAVNYWVSLVSPHLSESEVNTIIEFYKTPAGRKYAIVSIESSPKYSEFFNIKTNEAVKVELNILDEEINSILKDFYNKEESAFDKIINFVFSIFS